MQQIEAFLKDNGVNKIKLIVASSLGADLAIYFMKNSKIPVKAAFFDGGQFAKMSKLMRRILAPIIYSVIKGLYKKNGENLGKIMCATIRISDRISWKRGRISPTRICVLSYPIAWRINHFLLLTKKGKSVFISSLRALKSIPNIEKA